MAQAIAGLAPTVSHQKTAMAGASDHPYRKLFA